MGLNMKTSAATDTAIPVDDVEALRLTYRDAMARMAAAVNIVTSNGPGGLAGFAATAVCSVTDSPPTLLVCLNRNASVYPAVAANGVLCVNVLSQDHQELSRLFGGKTPVAERFAAADWSELVTGSPALEDVQREVAERDLRDSTRPIAPLKQASDARIIDSSSLSIEQVVARIVTRVREVEAELCASL